MLIQIIISSFIVSIISFSGGLFLFQKRFFTDRFLTYFVSFAAGVMITAAFLDLLPEALEGFEQFGIHDNVLLPAFLGVVFFFFLERYVLWFHHHHGLHGTRPSSVLILLGDTLHNFIDGIAIAASFLTNPGVGIATTLAIAAHEIPQEIADLSILVHGGMKRSHALLFNFLSALSAMIGAILGYFFLENIEGLVPYFLSFTGGMFIYIACSDLIPDLHREFKKSKVWFQSIPFILGIAVLYATILFLE